MDPARSRAHADRVELNTVQPVLTDWSSRYDHLREVTRDEALAAVSSPAARLAVALAGVHAARPKAILSMRVDDVELGDRRLTIAGRVRPLDDLTRHVPIEWCNTGAPDGPTP